MGTRLAALATLALLLVLPACAQTDEPAAKAASSVQDDVKAELDTMVVPQEDIGGLPRLRVRPDSGWQDNGDEAESSINPNDSAASLKQSGRVTGYQLTYYDPTQAALQTGSGILSFFTSVELFRSESVATAYLEDRTVYKQGLHGTSPREGVTFRSVTPFDTPVGEEAGYGFREDVVFGSDHVFRAVIGFRRGPIVATAMVVRADRDDAAELTTQIAGQLDSRIQNALTGRINEEPVLIPKDGVPLDGQQPTTEKPAGAPDLAPVALGPADLPAGIAADPGEYSRTKPPRFTFRRFFSPQGAAIGQTRLVGLRNEVSVLESEVAASTSINLSAMQLNSPDAIKTFQANFAATSGLRAKNVERRQVSLEDGLVGFVTTFDTDAGALLDFYVMAQRGRGTVTLEAFCLADSFHQEDLLPLLDKVGDRLEAALDKS